MSFEIACMSSKPPVRMSKPIWEKTNRWLDTGAPWKTYCKRRDHCFVSGSSRRQTREVNVTVTIYATNRPTRGIGVTIPF